MEERREEGSLHKLQGLKKSVYQIWFVLLELLLYGVKTFWKYYIILLLLLLIIIIYASGVCRSRFFRANQTHLDSSNPQMLNAQNTLGGSTSTVSTMSQIIWASWNVVQTELVTGGIDATLYVWFLCHADIYTVYRSVVSVPSGTGSVFMQIIFETILDIKKSINTLWSLWA